MIAPQSQQGKDFVFFIHVENIPDDNSDLYSWDEITGQYTHKHLTYYKKRPSEAI